MCVTSVHICPLKNSWEADPLQWTYLDPISESEKLYFLSLTLSVFYVADRHLIKLPPPPPRFSLWYILVFQLGSGLGLLTSGPGSQPARPSPRAMASLQSQLCNRAPWLWRNPPEHKVSLVNSWELWQMFWAFSPGILTSLWGFYDSTVNISNTDIGALRKECQEIRSVLHNSRSPLLILEVIRNASYFWECTKMSHATGRAHTPGGPTQSKFLLIDGDGLEVSNAHHTRVHNQGVPDICQMTMEW